MKNILRAALAALCGVATVPVNAAPRTSFHFVSDGAGADMFGSTSTDMYYVSFAETAQKGANKAEGVSLNFHLCTQTPPDNAGNVALTCVYGSGTIPLTAIRKVQQGRSAPTLVSISVKDLNAIPTFFVWGESCNPAPACQSILPPSPFAISAVVRLTNQAKTDEDVSRTSEFYTPDGTLIKESIRGKLVSASAIGTATIGGVALGPNTAARTFDERAVVHARLVSKPGK